MMGDLITVTSIKRSKKDKGPPSASKKERHARPPPLIPSLQQLTASLTSQQSSSASQLATDASPLEVVCKLFGAVIEHGIDIIDIRLYICMYADCASCLLIAGNGTVRQWMNAAHDAMCNAICDYQEMASSVSSLQAINERLHGYMNMEHATVVRHKRHLEQSNALLTAENADLRRQLAATNNTTAPSTIPSPVPGSVAANGKGIVVSVAPVVPLSIIVPSTVINNNTHDATPRYGQQNNHGNTNSNGHSNNSIIKSPSNDSLPALRRSLSKDNHNIAPLSPSSPVDADSVLRALEAKLAMVIGSPPLSVPLLSTSPKSGNDITISVTKLTRRNSNTRHSGVRRSRSSSGDDSSPSSLSPLSTSPSSSSSSSSSAMIIDTPLTTATTRRGSGKSQRNSRSTSPLSGVENMEHMRKVTTLISTPRASNLTISLNQRPSSKLIKDVPSKLSPSSSSSSLMYPQSSSPNSGSTATNMASLAMLRAVRDEWSSQSAQRTRC